jgi:hypothetical protein
MKTATETVRAVFTDEDVVLAETFYREAPSSGGGTPKPRLAALDAAGKRRKAQKPKPDHYEIICISIYNDDLARLDAKVDALKAKGHRRMTRSALIRYALDRLSVEDVPRSPF